MKKIIFLTPVLAFGFLSSSAQNAVTAPGTKVITIEESKQIYGSGKATIIVDGKTMLYSEYAAMVKAQQLSQNNQVTQPVNLTYGLSITNAGSVTQSKTVVPPVTPANYKPMTVEEMNAQLKAAQPNFDKKTAELMTKYAPVNNTVPANKPVDQNKPVYEIPKPATGSILLNAQNANVQKSVDPSYLQSPANNVKPVPVKSTGLGTQVDPAEISASNARIAAANNTVTAKPIVGNNLPTGSTLNLSVGAVNDAMHAVTPSGTNNIGLLKVDNTKQATMTEVPASVVNPATKVPAATNMQGTEKAKAKE